MKFHFRWLSFLNVIRIFSAEKVIWKQGPHKHTRPQPQEMIFKIFLTKTGQKRGFYWLRYGFFILRERLSFSFTRYFSTAFPRLPIKLILRSIATRNASSFVFWFSVLQHFQWTKRGAIADGIYSTVLNFFEAVLSEMCGWNACGFSKNWSSLQINTSLDLVYWKLFGYSLKIMNLW